MCDVCGAIHFIYPRKQSQSVGRFFMLGPCGPAKIKPPTGYIDYMYPD
jgi:hypothetical protein